MIPLATLVGDLRVAIAFSAAVKASFVFCRLNCSLAIVEGINARRDMKYDTADTVLTIKENLPEHL